MARPQSLTSTAGATAPTLTDLVLTATNIAAATASATLIDVRNDTLAHLASDVAQFQKDVGTRINAIHTALNAVINAMKLDNTLS